MKTLKETTDYMKVRMQGVRNDGVTPAWQHPIDVLNVFEEMCAAVGRLNRWENEYEKLQQICLLHDIIEDGVHSDGNPVTMGSLLYAGFDQDTVYQVNLLSKPDDCKSSAPQGHAELIKYFSRMLTATADHARIVKVLDRIANMREAVGVFSPKRLERYCWESQVMVMGLAQTVMNPWGEWLRNELQKTIDTARAAL